MGQSKRKVAIRETNLWYLLRYREESLGSLSAYLNVNYQHLAKVLKAGTPVPYRWFAGMLEFFNVEAKWLCSPLVPAAEPAEAAALPEPDLPPSEPRRPKVVASPFGPLIVKDNSNSNGHNYRPKGKRNDAFNFSRHIAEIHHDSF